MWDLRDLPKTSAGAKRGEWWRSLSSPAVAASLAASLRIPRLDRGESGTELSCNGLTNRRPSYPLPCPALSICSLASPVSPLPRTFSLVPSVCLLGAALATSAASATAYTGERPQEERNDDAPALRRGAVRGQDRVAGRTLHPVRLIIGDPAPAGPDVSWLEEKKAAAPPALASMVDGGGNDATAGEGNSSSGSGGGSDSDSGSDRYAATPRPALVWTLDGQAAAGEAHECSVTSTSTSGGGGGGGGGCSCWGDNSLRATTAGGKISNSTAGGRVVVNGTTSAVDSFVRLVACSYSERR